MTYGDSRKYSPFKVFVAIILGVLLFGGIGWGAYNVVKHWPHSHSKVVAKTSPTPSSAHYTLFSNDSETVKVPDGWIVKTHDNSQVVLQSKQGNALIVIVAQSFNITATAQFLQEGVNNNMVAAYTSVKACPNTSTVNTSISGVKGVRWEECFVANGLSPKAQEGYFFVGTSASGYTDYEVLVYASQADMGAVKSQVNSIESGLTWKIKA